MKYWARLRTTPSFFRPEKDGVRPPGCEDALGAGDPDAGHPEQGLIVGPLDLHRKLVQVAQGPAALGVQTEVEVGPPLVQQLLGPKVVEAQQPVRLIQPVLTQQGRLKALGSGEQGAGGDGDIGGVEDPLQMVLVVEPLGEHQDVAVALRRGTYDHLSGLTRRGEAGGHGGIWVIPTGTG